MKKVVCILTILMGAVSIANAQSNNIKLNIFSPFVNTGSVFFERQLTAKSSAQLGVFYTSYSNNGTLTRGFGITPEYHFYLTGKKAMEGLYVGPYLRFQRFTLSDKYEVGNGQTVPAEAVLNVVGGGGVVGYQWLIKNRLSIDPFLGIGYNKASLDLRAGREEALDVVSFGRVGFRPGVNVGFVF